MKFPILILLLFPNNFRRQVQNTQTNLTILYLISWCQTQQCNTKKGRKEGEGKGEGKGSSWLKKHKVQICIRKADKKSNTLITKLHTLAKLHNNDSKNIITGTEEFNRNGSMIWDVIMAKTMTHVVKSPINISLY